MKLTTTVEGNWPHGVCTLCAHCSQALGETETVDEANAVIVDLLRVLQPFAGVSHLILAHRRVIHPEAALLRDHHLFAVQLSPHRSLQACTWRCRAGSNAGLPHGHMLCLASASLPQQLAAAVH